MDPITPDAPTGAGRTHLYEGADCRRCGRVPEGAEGQHRAPEVAEMSAADEADWLDALAQWSRESIDGLDLLHTAGVRRLSCPRAHHIRELVQQVVARAVQLQLWRADAHVEEGSPRSFLTSRLLTNGRLKPVGESP